jgi:uncharacterized LabA/DUF88 family protein
MALWLPGQAQETDVALLVDWENLKWSLLNLYGVAPNISSLITAAKEYGRLVLARAYGDWTQERLREDAPNLYRAGIEPTYAPGRNPINGARLKNSADIRLVVDAVEMCGRLPHITTYILVTGDADLIHALNFLRLQGRRVIVIGVGQSLSALLSAAADAVLLYERDIEPLRARIDTPRAEPSNANIPALEVVFGWIVDFLRERGDGMPCSFNTLGHELKQRRGLNARAWYNLPFKQLMLLAAREGRVHLSTSGSMDYVSLPGPAALSAVATAATADADECAQALGAGSTVGLDSLSADEWHEFLRFIRALQAGTPYMTFKFIVENAVYRSVLPRLSREQVSSLINDLADREVLLRRKRQGNGEDGADFEFTVLVINEDAARVREALAAPPTTPAPTTEGEAAPPDPFAALLPALAEVKQLSGVGYFPRVQQALERRLGVSVRDCGYSSLSLFFGEAERRGLVRIGWYNGAHILVCHDEEVPEEVPLLQALRARHKIGEALDEECAEAMPAPTRNAVRQLLGDEWLRLALRIIVTTEDLAGGPVHAGSLAYSLRGTLAAQGAPALSASQVNRLFKQELVEEGWMLEEQDLGLDPKTGLTRPMKVYRLDREHPAVKSAMVAGPIPHAEVEIRPLYFATSNVE